MTNPKNEGVFFVKPDHPVCAGCVSSLGRDECCEECGGDGWVDRDEYRDGLEQAGGIITCPECCGEPAGWFCPTCHRHWPFYVIQFPEEDSP